MDVTKLINKFECIAQMHVNIESFRTGDTWEIAISGAESYPQLYLLQMFDISGVDNRKTWAVKFRIHAIQQRDESDENQLLDSTFTIFQQVLEYLRQDSDYIISADYQAFSFTEADDDYLCGWAVTISLTDATSVDRCTIDNVFPSPVQLCDYATALMPTASTRQIVAVWINGSQNLLNGNYIVNSPFIGNDEVTRLRNDLTALGYVVGGQTLALGQSVTSFSITITQTADVFNFVEGQTGNFLFNQSNCS